MKLILYHGGTERRRRMTIDVPTMKFEADITNQVIVMLRALRDSVVNHPRRNTRLASRNASPNASISAGVL